MWGWLAMVVVMIVVGLWVESASLFLRRLVFFFFMTLHVSMWYVSVRLEYVLDAWKKEIKVVPDQEGWT